jgi:hypothetical protein
MEYLIKATRPGAKNDSQAPNPGRPRPLAGPAPGAQPSTDSPASQEIQKKIASAQEDRAAGRDLLSAIIRESRIASEPKPPAAEPALEAPDLEPMEAEPEQSAEAAPETPDDAGEAQPATAQRDPDRAPAAGALDTFIERTTLAADRIGLLAVAIGAATLLAAILLRRLRRGEPMECSTD